MLEALPDNQFPHSFRLLDLCLPHKLMRNIVIHDITYHGPFTLNIFYNLHSTVSSYTKASIKKKINLEKKYLKQMKFSFPFFPSIGTKIYFL